MEKQEEIICLLREFSILKDFEIFNLEKQNEVLKKLAELGYKIKWKKKNLKNN